MSDVRDGMVARLKTMEELIGLLETATDALRAADPEYPIDVETLDGADVPNKMRRAAIAAADLCESLAQLIPEFVKALGGDDMEADDE
jgi:hypothetical protein